MKIKQIRLVMAMLALVACPNALMAQTFKSGDVTYEILSTTDKTCKAVKADFKYNGAGVEGVVEYNGEEYKVTTIGTGCFSNSDLVEYINIGHGNVTTLEKNCISNCKNLKSITISPYIDPETNIDYPFFSNCPNLEMFVCGSNVVGGKLEAGYVSIDGTVHANHVLTDTKGGIVVYPPAMEAEYLNLVATRIYPYAFYQHKKVKNVISDGHGPAEIDEHAFEGSSIETVTFSKGDMNKIGEYAFAKCANLTTFNFGDASAFYSLKEIPSHCFFRCPKLKGMTLPVGLETIGSSAFEECASLDGITMYGVKNIEYEAFMNCSALSVDFTKMPLLEKIGYSAFEGCSSLGEIDFSKNDKLTEIGAEAFYKCTDATHNLTLKDGALPKNLTSLGSFAFAYSSLHSTSSIIKIPYSLATMGDNPFAGNQGIESFYMFGSGDRNFMVKDNALFDINLTRLVCYPSKLRYSDDHIQGAAWGSLTNTAHQGFIVPPTVHEIDPYAFQNCEDLVHVVLPSELQVLEIGTFANCTSLASITIPAKVNSIFQGAFYNCTSLKEVFAMRETPVHLDENNYDTSEIGGKPAFSGVTDCTLYTKPNMNSDNIADAYKNFSEYDGLFKEITYEIPLTIGASGYVTMARDFDVNLRSDNEDLRPYTITDFDADAGTVTLKALSVKNGTKYSTNRYVPSRVEKDGLYQLYNGVVVKGTPGKTYHVWMGVGDYSREESKRWKAVESTTNMLYGCPVETYVSRLYNNRGPSYCRFILVDGKWHEASEDGMIPANRAYLSLLVEDVMKWEGSGSSKSLSVVFDNGDGEVTGIDELQMQPAKAGEDVYYTLSGMRVTKPVRGIYIKNGKKVVIK